MDVTLRMLQQFVVLAEEKHFGRAAVRLNMQQPPLSQAIQKLEGSLGVLLIDRSTRAFALTAAGEAFAADAERILTSTEATLARTRRIAAGIDGVLHVGAVSGLTFEFVPRVVRAADAAYPDLRIDLALASSPALVDAVARGELDVAFVRGSLDLPSDIETVPLFDERFGAALPAAHPLAARTALDLAELASDPFVMPASTALRHLDALVGAACRAAGFAPIVAARSDSLPGLLSLVAAGKGVTLVSESAARHVSMELAFVPVREPDELLSASVSAIVRRRRDDRAVDRVIELAREAAGTAAAEAS